MTTSDVRAVYERLRDFVAAHDIVIVTARAEPFDRYKPIDIDFTIRDVSSIPKARNGLNVRILKSRPHVSDAIYVDYLNILNGADVG